jgi:hypothetical protein
MDSIAGRRREQELDYGENCDPLPGMERYLLQCDPENGAIAIDVSILLLLGEPRRLLTKYCSLLRREFSNVRLEMEVSKWSTYKKIHWTFSQPKSLLDPCPQLH